MGRMWAYRAQRAACAAIASVALLAGAESAPGQEWKPTKPVELVVGNAPGGAMDRLARLSESFLKSKNLIPEKSIVLHKPGGGHAVALAYIKGRARDPHYLMAVNTLLISNSPLGRSELKHSDFTPVAILYEEPMVFAVKGDSKIKDAADLAERLKKNPTSVSFSVSAGLGTSNHMAAVLLAKAVGAPIQAVKTVSFDSGSEGITAVLGGHVDVVVTAPGSMMQFVNSKEMRIIALAGEERVGGALADVPTWKEVGYDVAVSSWRGIVAPPGLTPAQVDFWQKAFAEFMQSDLYKKSAEEEIFTARYMNAATTGQFLAQMDQQFREYLKVVGVEAK
jgi:putative tricarboxylic transport membrane protein